MRRYLLPVVILALFAGLIAVFAVGLKRDPTSVPSPLIGKPAPDFDLPELREPGKRVTAAELRGQMTLLNVWATWCSGCRQEHETLLAIARESGVPIVGLNWKDDPESARRWLQALGDPYVAVAVDTVGDVAIDWGVYGAPETFLIGPDGTVLYKHIAPITAEVWEREFLPRIRAWGAGS
jgi:cytochrome c biogenesis protein CcmG/thiol:disulfide interchange protein DsbE